MVEMRKMGFDGELKATKILRVCDRGFRGDVGGRCFDGGDDLGRRATVDGSVSQMGFEWVVEVAEVCVVASSSVRATIWELLSEGFEGG